jgi:hypothetical protein
MPEASRHRTEQIANFSCFSLYFLYIEVEVLVENPTMAVHTIHLSTDVFAAVWADRKPGEDSEEAIIARKFGVKLGRPEGKGERVGWADPRHGVQLMAGEEVFRVYKGREYRARAEDGFLILPNGMKCNSLNQLSRTIGARTENAWQNWYAVGKDGKRELIAGRRTK